MSIINKIEKGEFELWLHPAQKNGSIDGNTLYKYLKENNLLDDCATSKDLEDIQKKGIKFFRNHFGDNFVYAWKSVRRRNGYLYVPCLYELGDEVVLGWRWLALGWHSHDPALRLASSSKPHSTTQEVRDILPSELIINGVKYVRK